jgi:hypothetical protein
MLSSNTSEPAKPCGPEAGKTETPAVLDPRNTIEVASQGSGTINDPSGTDRKPPGISDSCDDYPC